MADIVVFKAVVKFEPPKEAFTKGDPIAPAPPV